jgi:DnaK suppressor protein
MAMKKAMLPFLKADAEKGAARSDAAKQQVRAAKTALKRARKLFKAAKKSAKEARKKLEGALAAMTRPPKKPGRRRPARQAKPAVKAPVVKAGKKAAVSRKPRRAKRPRASAPRDHMRSASDVAKSVIQRLQSPPPTLAPAPLMPSDPPSANDTPEVKP